MLLSLLFSGFVGVGGCLTGACCSDEFCVTDWLPVIWFIALLNSTGFELFYGDYCCCMLLYILGLDFVWCLFGMLVCRVLLLVGFVYCLVVLCTYLMFNSVTLLLS